MEDLSEKLLSLEELNPRFEEEEIREVLKNNYNYSSELLKDRLFFNGLFRRMIYEGK